MPEFIHNRAEHLLAKNPKMDKSQAFAIATQQSHALGKSPKGYGTASGRKKAKAKYSTPKDDKKTANPGSLDSPKLASFVDEVLKLATDKIPGGLADDKTDDDFDKEQLDMGQKVELEHVDDPALAREVARDHLAEHDDYYTRLKKIEDGVEKTSSALRKLGMIPPYPGQFQPENQAKKLLEKSQKVGTPDDPKGPVYKSLNMLKPPKPPTTASSSTSSIKVGGVARSFFAKFAFDVSPYSGVLSYGGFRQTSGVRPIGEGVAPASSFDERLAGNAPVEGKEKKAFRGSAFGPTSSHGAWDGNGGYHASQLPYVPVPAASVLDPHLKVGSGSDDLIERAKKALMVKESLA